MTSSRSEVPDPAALAVPAAIGALPDEGLRVPMGRRVVLPGRGTTFVRQSGSPSAPHTVLLVHGWMASGGLNWATTFQPLGEHFRVVAPDLRGHGRGIKTRRRFRLEDCADDLGALIDELGCGPVIVVGYSMGGVISQLLWQRRPDVVAGLVLCSTTRRFVPGRRERYIFANTMNYGAGTIRISRMATRIYAPLGLQNRPRLRRGRPSSMRMWMIAELRRHDLRQVLEAAHETCQFDSRRWIGTVNVPTAVIVTTKDRAIPPNAQRRLADSIPEAVVFEFAGDHTACGQPEYQSVLLEACRQVVHRVWGEAGG